MARAVSTPTADHAEIGQMQVCTDSWCPGNATRYELTLIRGPGIFCWTNAPGGGGRAITLAPPDDIEIDATYLGEKFRCDRTADMAALLAWLGRRGYAVAMPSGYNGFGVYTGRTAP